MSGKKAKKKNENWETTPKPNTYVSFYMRNDGVRFEMICGFNKSIEIDEITTSKHPVWMVKKKTERKKRSGSTKILFSIKIHVK